MLEGRCHRNGKNCGGLPNQLPGAERVENVDIRRVPRDYPHRSSRITDRCAGRLVRVRAVPQVQWSSSIKSMRTQAYGPVAQLPGGTPPSPVAPPSYGAEPFSSVSFWTRAIKPALAGIIAM